MSRSLRQLAALSLIPLLLAAGCASRAPRGFITTSPSGAPSSNVALDGSLHSYLALLSERSPALAAARARSRAASRRVDGAAPWPQPTVSYTGFVRPVETRVGPQRQRVGLVVPLAWPGTRRAERTSRRAMARASRARVDQRALEQAYALTVAYWSLWATARRVANLEEHGVLLATLAEVARARLVTGGSVARAQRVDVERERLLNRVSSLHARADELRATLRELLDLDDSAELPVAPTAPERARVGEARDALLADARATPAVHAQEAESDASEADAERASRQRWPSVALRMDWIETGPSRATPGSQPERSGQDALMVGVSVALPTNAGSARAEAGAAILEGEAHRLEAHASARRAERELATALSRIDETAERIERIQSSILAGARAAFEGALGDYSAGRGSLDDSLATARLLTEIGGDLDDAFAEHALAWALIERAVGREVERQLERTESLVERDDDTSAPGPAPPTDVVPGAVEGGPDA